MKYRLASLEDIEKGIETLYFKSMTDKQEYKHTYFMLARPGSIDSMRTLFVDSPSKTIVGNYYLIKTPYKVNCFCINGATDWVVYVEDKPMVLDYDGDDEDCI